MTDSSTGGFLLPETIVGPPPFSSPTFSAPAFSVTPVPLPEPLEDRDLYEVLQETVVGISGMDPTLVRPRWQPEPSPIPLAATCWCAVGVTDLESDTYPFVGQMLDGSWQLQRHETFTMYCSFYDLGYGGVAGRQAAVLRDGLMVPQNREALAANDIYLVSDADLEVEPTLFKTRWRVQVDLRVRLRRQITRHYAVQPLVSASAKLYTDDGQPPRTI